MISKKALGGNIKKARKAKSIKLNKTYTGQDLADEIGISRSYLGDIESGRIYPNIELLNKIANALDVETSDLLGGTEEPFTIKESVSEYTIDELELEFERLKPKIRQLPQEDKERIINIIKAYLKK